MRVQVVDGTITRPLRRAVLRPNLTEEDPLPGDEIAGAVHLAALDDDGSVLGTCFIYPDACPWRSGDLPAWRLRQMATAAGQRGRGIGAAVLAAAIGYVDAHGGGILWCNARKPAVPFYARHGLLRAGPIFVEHDIPHQRMWLPSTRREPRAGPTSST